MSRIDEFKQWKASNNSELDVIPSSSPLQPHVKFEEIKEPNNHRKCFKQNANNLNFFNQSIKKGRLHSDNNNDK
jgi:hypothetical protein